ncbi:MAG: DNA internalization-related competence protein ComEC/Rec2, partial [Planctomycetota bacterium]
MEYCFFLYLMMGLLAKEFLLDCYFFGSCWTAFLGTLLLGITLWQWIHAKRFLTKYIFLILIILSLSFQTIEKPFFPPLRIKGELKGKILWRPKKTPNGWKGKAEGRFVSSFMHLKGIFYIYLEGKKPVWAGTCFSGKGTLVFPKKPTNWGERDGRKGLWRKGIKGFFIIGKKESSSFTIQNSAFSCLYWLHRFRKKSKEAICCFSPPLKRILLPLAFGEYPNNSEILSQFQKTGAAHFLAISGLHLAILYGIFLSLFYLLGLKRKACLLLSILLLSFYLPLGDFKMTLLRAYLALALFSFQKIFLLPQNKWNFIGLGGSLLLFFFPEEAFSIGFYLTFGALLAIVWLYPKIEESLLKPKLFYISQATSSFSDLRFILITLFKKGIQIIGISLAIFLILSPLLVYAFGILSLLSPLANLLLLPILALLLLFLFSLLMSFWLLPWLQPFLVYLIEILAHLFIQINHSLYQWGFYYYLPPPHPVKIGIYYTCLFVIWESHFLSHSTYKEKIHKLLHFKPLLLFGFVVLISLSFFSKQEKGWSVTMLDMGHGLAIVSHSQEGTILYDGGSRFYNKCGSNIILPFLRWKGITSLDLLILSHSDSDHINGIFSLFGKISIGQIWINEDFQRSHLGEELVLQAQKWNIPVYQVQEGWQAQKGLLHISVLSPPKMLQGLGKENDLSLVVLINRGKDSLLLTGDIQKWGTARLLRKYKLSPTIIVLPHHGRQREVCQRIVEAYDPKIILNSDYKIFWKTLPFSPERRMIHFTSFSGAIELIQKEKTLKWNLK